MVDRIPELELRQGQERDNHHRKTAIAGPGYAYGDCPILDLKTWNRLDEIEGLCVGNKALSQVAEAQLIRNYPKLTKHDFTLALRLNILELSKQEKSDLLADIFLNFSQGDRRDNALEKLGSRVIDIDDRNFSSHLTNLVPQSDSQAKALLLANKFLDFKDLQPAIFFLEGEGGRGKTHIALGMAKRYLQEAKKVYFLSGLKHRLPTAFDINKMKAADVIVLDDLNACEGIEDTIKEIVRDCHEQSKRLIITSNVSPKSIMDQLYPPGKDHEKEGFKNRFENALLHQKITTNESYRNKGLQAMQRFFTLGDEDKRLIRLWKYFSKLFRLSKKP